MVDHTKRPFGLAVAQLSLVGSVRPIGVLDTKNGSVRGLASISVPRTVTNLLLIISQPF
jgi:hypothetical protein